MTPPEFGSYGHEQLAEYYHQLFEMTTATFLHLEDIIDSPYIVVGGSAVPILSASVASTRGDALERAHVGRVEFTYLCAHDEDDETVPEIVSVAAYEGRDDEAALRAYTMSHDVIDDSYDIQIECDVVDPQDAKSDLIRPADQTELLELRALLLAVQASVPPDDDLSIGL